MMIFFSILLNILLNAQSLLNTRTTTTTKRAVKELSKTTKQFIILIQFDNLIKQSDLSLFIFNKKELSFIINMSRIEYLA